VSLVEEYMTMIQEFGLDDKKVYDRVDGRMAAPTDKVGSMLATTEAYQNERREQDEPIAG
jgi:hypothetical protein